MALKTLWITNSNIHNNHNLVNVWECNIPIKPPVRLLIGGSVIWMVSLSVVISQKGREAAIPCSYGDTVLRSNSKVGTQKILPFKINYPVVYTIKLLRSNSKVGTQKILPLKINYPVVYTIKLPFNSAILLFPPLCFEKNYKCKHICKNYIIIRTIHVIYLILQ